MTLALLGIDVDAGNWAWDIFELDLRGNLTFFNTALCRITGLPAAEIAGINYREYTTPETAEKMFQVFRRVYQTARPSGIQDFEILMRDGRRIAIDLTASPILGADGSVIGFRSPQSERYRQRVPEKPRIQKA
jgi:PAS domain S-box-containing protein